MSTGKLFVRTAGNQGGRRAGWRCGGWLTRSWPYSFSKRWSRFEGSLAWSLRGVPVESGLRRRDHLKRGGWWLANWPWAKLACIGQDCSGEHSRGELLTKSMARS